MQQQVQIPDLRRLPVSVKSSEYIMAKIQTHRAGAGAGQGAGQLPVTFTSSRRRDSLDLSFEVDIKILS